MYHFDLADLTLNEAKTIILRVHALVSEISCMGDVHDQCDTAADARRILERDED